MSLGSKVLDIIRIENNVFVAPIPVVTKDVPVNWNVGGVLAMIIKDKK